MDYKPRPLQAAIREHNARFKIAVLHRRYGKSTMACAGLCQDADEHPGFKCLYISPFASQSKAIVWSYLEALAEPYGATFTKTDLTAHFPNGSTVQLLGASAGWYQSLRGRSADRIVLDEVPGIEPDAWRSILRPRRRCGSPC